MEQSPLVLGVGRAPLKPRRAFLVIAATMTLGCEAPWQQLRVEADGFSVEMPGQATYTATVVELKEGVARGGTWCFVRGGGPGPRVLIHEAELTLSQEPRMVCVMSLSLPEVRGKTADPASIVTQMKARFLQGFDHGEWLREDAARNPEGRWEFFCRGSLFKADVIGRARLQMRVDRVYVLYAVGSTERTVMGPGANRFFDSFVLLEYTHEALR